jgi:hypothetical protein
VHPGAAELAEIVRKPAEAAGLTYERNTKTCQSLDEKLLEDAGRADMLPLLQFTLQELFERCELKGAEATLTFAAYDEIGGLDGAIDKRAEATLAVLGEAEQGSLPRLLRQLAVPARERDRGTSLTIRSVPMDDAAPNEPAKRLVKTLVDARILLSSGEAGEASVRLAHERVLKSWSRARDIVRDNAEFYRIREDVEDQLRRWETSGKKRDLLIPRGVPLAEAEDAANKFPGEFASPALNFIDISGRRARLRQRVTAGAALLFAGVAALAGWQQQVAERQRALAEENLAMARGIWRELTPHTGSHSGYFIGDHVAERAPGGSGVVLREPIVFVDTDGRRWALPAGQTIEEEASLKKLYGQFRKGHSLYNVQALPFVIHSYYCKTRERSWEDTNKMFYAAMRAVNIDDKTAKILYGAVYLFGPRWGSDGQLGSASPGQS